MNHQNHQSVSQALRFGLTSLDNQPIKPKAWVYFVWVVIGKQVHCKIGQSINPSERISQVTSAIPQIPFFIQLLPCLNLEQARLFEGMLHKHLNDYRAKRKSEWFTDPNLNRLSNQIRTKVNEIITLANSFGYDIQMQGVERSGPYPVLYPNGYIDYVVDPTAKTD